MRTNSTILYFAPLVLAGVLALSIGRPRGADSSAPASPAADPATTSTLHAGGDSIMETATFAAGCFWGVEATFRQVKGVVDTAVGYTGGHTENPTYKQVCTDTTGHAEAVQVVFDPSKVSFEQLLDVFWQNHNPTTPNRQGPDVGSQYRSAIFYHSLEQKAAAEASKKQLDESGKFRRPVVTEVVPASAFYRAEDYHQRYLEKRGLATCHLPGS